MFLIKLIAVLSLIFIGCSKAPMPRKVSAPKDQLTMPPETQNLTITPRRTFESSTDVFSLFLWPDNTSREELKVISHNVAKYGIKIDNTFNYLNNLGISLINIEKKLTFSPRSLVKRKKKFSKIFHVIFLRQLKIRTKFSA